MGDGFAMGDYLHGFLEGLSAALRGKGRQTIQIKLPELNEFTLGQIIALYERAVAVYAEFININAFHQPGVQAYKLAANGILELAAELNTSLKTLAPLCGSAADIAAKVGKADKTVEIAGLLDKAALNSENVSRSFDTTSGTWIYSVK